MHCEMNRLVLALLLAFVHSCRCSSYPLDCQVERFGGFIPPQVLEDYALANTTGSAITISPDCTVSHLLMNWWKSDLGSDANVFQPLYQCTVNSTEITSELNLYYVRTDSRILKVEDQSVQLPFGSQCTFGGCYTTAFPHLVYRVEPVTCTIDFDECASPELNNCHSGSGATCVNTIGSFQCVCSPGYTWNGTHCLDVNECTGSGQHNCSESASCINTDGDYACLCPSGFAGNGFTCTNVDECSMPVSPCGLDPKVTCTDTEGSFTCECPTGYEWNEIYCQDVDECSQEGSCSESSECSNTEGSFVCICQPGFTRDGFICSNLNECLNGHDCHHDADCTDTDGGYICTCKTGFEGDGRTCSPPPVSSDSEKESTTDPLIAVLGAALAVVIVLSLCTVAFAAFWIFMRRRQRGSGGGDDPVNVDKEKYSSLS